jgi:ABC-type antimicrobial peptide transport system permease subunit
MTEEQATQLALAEFSDGNLLATLAAGLLTLVGGLTAYGPARRASRVDPLLALRTE